MRSKKTENSEVGKNHIALTSIETVSELMMPLLQRHGIKVFRYYKIYADGSVIRFATDRPWTEHFFKKNYLESMTLPKGCLNKPLNVFIWFIEDCPESLLDQTLNFDISNGITLAEKQEDYIEYFAFGSSRSNTSIINNFYLNNLDLLHNYCIDFREKAKNLLDAGEKQKILTQNLSLQPNDRALFSTSLPPFSKLLSPRQTACASLLLEGKTHKEIARALNISSRTVETHLNLIRKKMDCESTIDLVTKLSILIK